MTDKKTMDEVVDSAMYDPEIWQAVQVDDSPFIRFDEGIMKVVTFTSNDPDEIFDNDYGSETFAFDVLDVADNTKRLEISSKRLKAALFQVMPINQGSIGITKTGTGFETRYEVVKLD